MIKLVLKNLLRNKRRSFLTLIGVIIGVAGIVSLVSISFGMAQNISELMEAFQGIFIIQAGVVDEQFSVLSLDYAEKLQEVSGVKHVLPEIWTMIVKDSSTTSVGPPIFMIIGIDPELSKDYDASLYYKPLNGRKLKSTDKNSILISEELRKTNNLFIGNQLKISGENYRIIGTFEANSPMLQMAIIMSLDDARRFTELKDGYTMLFQAIPEKPEEQALIKDRINLRFKGELEAMNMQDYSDLMNDILSGVRTALWAISAIAGIVGGIVVMNTMLMSVMERTKEFGALKAIGWQNKHIRNMVLSESIILSIIGGIIGILLGIAISQIAQTYIRIPTIVTLELMIQALLFAIILGIIGGLYPSRKAMNMSPVEALR
jgi:putative ABC transport system permease protein